MAYGTLLSHSCATRPKKNGLKLQENQAVIFGGWRPCNTSFNALIIKCINGLYFKLRCNKGIKKVLWLKISHILNVMIAVRS